MFFFVKYDLGLLYTLIDTILLLVSAFVRFALAGKAAWLQLDPCTWTYAHNELSSIDS